MDRIGSDGLRMRYTDKSPDMLIGNARIKKAYKEANYNMLDSLENKYDENESAKD